MYKKFSLTFLVIAIIGSTSVAQTKSLAFGIIYTNYTRTNLDSYVDFFTQSVEIPDMEIANAYGIEFIYSSRNKNTEGIFGGSCTLGGFNRTVSTDNSRSLALKQSNFSIHFGVDQYILPWFFVGGQFLVTGFSGRAKYENTGSFIPADTLIDFTEDNLNFLVGYGLGLRAETGFYVPLKNEGSGIKIMGYYDLGITKFDFYNSFDKVITSYTGDKKTKGKAFGVQLLFTIPLGGG